MAVPFWRSREVRGYLFAVAATAAAVILRLLLFGLLGDQAPFFPFILAVLITAWFGGFKPGLTATVLGALLAIYYSRPPAHPSLVEQVGRMGAVWIFGIIGLAASWVCGRLHAANRRITEKQRALEETEQALKEADRRKDEFLAVLAHELRNPLAPIRNALALIRRAQNDTAVMDQVRALMERQVAHMARLIEDLLDVSRITSGKLELRKERTELAEVVRSALEVSRPLIEMQEHELTVDLPPEPVYLHADPIRLAQVISNLLNNAAKYTPPGGHIWLKAGISKGEITITVGDTGIGFAASELPHIFQMFSQIAPSQERSQGGIGIGLSLSQGFMKLHGGSIEARSPGHGQGSEFTVRLPAESIVPGKPTVDR
jgi:signal transduction histidine kinase